MFSQFEGYIHATTPGAILFQSHFWEKPLWFPKSQSIIEQEIDSMESVVKVRDWLCKKNSILEFTAYSREEIEARSG